jgi:hypothetical protein
MFARCSIPSRGSRLLVVLNIATDRCIAVMVVRFLWTTVNKEGQLKTAR